MTKPLVIYHSNCADGFSAAWCFWHKYGEACDFHAGVYGKEPPDVTGRDVYLVDFSYKADVVEQMLRIANTVGAALTDYRELGDTETAPLLAAMCVLLLIALIGARWPAVLAWPLAAGAAWTAFNLGVRLWQRLDRRRRRP